MFLYIYRVFTIKTPRVSLQVRQKRIIPPEPTKMAFLPLFVSLSLIIMCYR